jgi:hypothetical protein
MKNVVYVEEQRGRRMGVFFLLAVVLILAVSRFIYALNYVDRGFEVFPMWVYLGVLATLTLGLIYFWRVRLTVKVTEKSIRAKYSPWHLGKRKIKLGDIDGFTIIKNQSLAQVNGWQIHFSSDEESYSLGNQSGIWIELKDGQKVFIGTREPELFGRILKNAGIALK